MEMMNNFQQLITRDSNTNAFFYVINCNWPLLIDDIFNVIPLNSAEVIDLTIFQAT